MTNNYSTNPTKKQRNKILLDSLTAVGRSSDYDNIINLLAPPRNIFQYGEPQSLSNCSIGIIGAGLSGLAAAYELRKLGARISLFDANAHRIGGRVYTHYFDKAKQYYGEFGAYRIPVSHETTWHYIDVFNLNTHSQSVPVNNGFIYANNVRVRKDPSGMNITKYLYPLYDLTQRERNTPWNELSAYATTTIINQLSPAVRTEILRILPKYSSEYLEAINRSTRQTYEYLGLSQGFIQLNSALEPLGAGALNSSYAEALSGIYSLDFSNVYGITGGTINLVKAFYQALSTNQTASAKQPKVDFYSGCTVHQIRDNNSTVTLKYNTPKNTSYEATFDYIICAIPFSTLRTISVFPHFSNQKMQAIREVNYVDSEKSLFLCRRQFWADDADYGNIRGGSSVTDLPIGLIFYPRDEPYASRNPGVFTASYNTNLDAIRLVNQTPHDRNTLLKTNIAQVHGLPLHALDRLVSQIKTVDWNSEPWSRGAYAYYLPGQKATFAAISLLPEYNNKVFFSGDHVSTKHGWMQGALQSGKLVANQIAKQIFRKYT